MKRTVALILALAAAVVCRAAPTIDATNTNNGACNQPCQSLSKFYSGLQVGEVVWYFGGWTGSGNAPTIGDDAGNLYVPVGPQRIMNTSGGAVLNVQLWRMVNQGNPTTVTLNTSNPTTAGWFDGIFGQVVAVHGINYNNPIDLATIATGSGTGTNYSVTSGALAYTNEMMWGFFMMDDAAEPYTNYGSYTDVGPNEAVQLPLYLNLSNTVGVTETVSATAHTSAQWVGIVVGMRTDIPGGCPDALGFCYVRQGATGANTGLNWNDAFTDLTPTLIRGATYLMAAGTYAPHIYQDADDGAKWITIQNATPSLHGTSIGWNPAYAGQVDFSCQAGKQYIATFGADYYSFNGMFRQKSSPEMPGTDWANGAAYGMKFDNSADCVKGGNPIVSGGTGFAGAPCGSSAACNASGVYLHDLSFQYVDEEGGDATTDAMADIGYEFQGGTYNVTLNYDEINNVANPIFIRGDHNCVSGCSSGGTFYLGNGTNLLIEHTYVNRNYSSATSHSEFCSCSEGVHNLVMAWDWIQNMVGTAVYAQAGSDTSPNGPVYFIGNVWTQSNASNCAVGGGVFGAEGEIYNQGLFFLNNTIAFNGYLDCPTTDEDGWGYGAQASTFQNVTWENNLWYRGDISNLNGISLVNSCTTCTFAGSTAAQVVWDHQMYANSPLSSSNDTDTNKQTVAGDPFVNSAAFNFNLSSNTAAGANTHAIAPLNDIDMVGNARGSNGVWDRGAFQIEGLPSPQPISGMSVVFSGQ